MKRVLWLGLGLIVTGIFLFGCGRLHPGVTKFNEPTVDTNTIQPSTSPIPIPPWFVLGPEEAKVRVVAFYPMDPEHKPLMDLLKGLSGRYPGKVYVKFMDVRSPEGKQAGERAGVAGYGLLINTRSSATINAKPSPYQVDFNQEPGRYWRLEDLEAAVAQEVAKVYGK